jgi:1L-myo-inositol 1-phosphate cytidylyltransferase
MISPERPFSLKNEIRRAVILMAGSGSRLRKGDPAFLKPLTPVAGRPLISYTLEALAKAGIDTICAVVGFESARVTAEVRRLVPRNVNLQFIENVHWQKQNGLSLLSAAEHTPGPFLLTMSDHIFDQEIVDLLLNSANVDVLNVAIDAKVASVFDLEDAMKVKTREDKIIGIGKHLRTYDAIDIGLFLCPEEILKYARRAQRDGDFSLADVVQLMAADGKVRGVDIGNLWWQDIDTPAMLLEAEQKLRCLVRS